MQEQHSGAEFVASQQKFLGSNLAADQGLCGEIVCSPRVCDSISSSCLPLSKHREGNWRLYIIPVVSMAVCFYMHFLHLWFIEVARGQRLKLTLPLPISPTRAGWVYKASRPMSDGIGFSRDPRRISDIGWMDDGWMDGWMDDGWMDIHTMLDTLTELTLISMCLRAKTRTRAFQRWNPDLDARNISLGKTKLAPKLHLLHGGSTCSCVTSIDGKSERVQQVLIH